MCCSCSEPSGSPTALDCQTKVEDLNVAYFDFSNPKLVRIVTSFFFVSQQAPNDEEDDEIDYKREQEKIRGCHHYYYLPTTVFRTKKRSDHLTVRQQ